MGDMADMAIDQLMDEWEAEQDWESGLMSHQEAYDRGIIDELGFEHWCSSQQETVTCSIPVTIMGHTNKAWLCELQNGITTWFPKSRCKLEGNRLIVPAWLLYKKDQEGELDG